MSQETNGLEEVVIESKTQDLSVPDTKIKTQQDIQEELKQLKYNNYLINFKSRVEMWKRDNGNRAMPLHWDTEYQDWVWLNRETRRQR